MRLIAEKGIDHMIRKYRHLWFYRATRANRRAGFPKNENQMNPSRVIARMVR
jgi:hypothetical protein